MIIRFVKFGPFSADAPLGIQQSQIADKRGAQRIVPEPPHRKESAGRLIKLLAGAGGNVRARNYDFARDNPHSSDLNAPSFCEDNILMSFFLFISTEMELFIYTREIAHPPPPPPLLFFLSSLLSG